MIVLLTMAVFMLNNMRLHIIVKLNFMKQYIYTLILSIPLYIF